MPTFLKSHRIRLFSHFAFLSLLIFITRASVAQTDTLSRPDFTKSKNAFKRFYLDSNFKMVPAPPAKYLGYNYLKKSGRYSKKDSIIYRPLNGHSQLPIAMDGTLEYYSPDGMNKRLVLKEIYKQGVLSEAVEFFYPGGAPEKTFIYFDSLHKEDPGTFLYYLEAENTLIYKQYVSYRKKPAFDKTFLVPHRDFKLKHRPIIGLHGITKLTEYSAATPFAELGLSRKYISGTRVDTFNLTYIDKRYVYHSANASLLFGGSDGQFYFGQKLSYGYNFYFARAEAGLVNYTDFKTTDLSVIVGVGFTVLGYFNGMLYISFPIVTQRTDAFPRFAFSIVFN